MIGLGITFVGNSESDDQGVYSDVPYDIAMEVENTTFVEATPDEPHYTGFEGTLRNVADNIGVSFDILKIMISFVIMIVLMGIVLGMTASYSVAILSGLACSGFLVFSGIMPIVILPIFLLIFAFIIITTRYKIEGEK